MTKDFKKQKKDHHGKPDNYKAPHASQRKEGSSKTDERETKEQKTKKSIC